MQTGKFCAQMMLNALIEKTGLKEKMLRQQNKVEFQNHLLALFGEERSARRALLPAVPVNEFPLPEP